MAIGLTNLIRQIFLHLILLCWLKSEALHSKFSSLLSSRTFNNDDGDNDDEEEDLIDAIESLEKVVEGYSALFPLHEVNKNVYF